MINTRKLVRISILSCIVVMLQMSLMFLPNVEFVSMLFILFSIVFGSEVFYIIFIFNILMGLLHGFGMWWYGYLIIWPILGVLSIALKNKFKENFLLWAIFSGIFGFVFGALFAIPYILIASLKVAFTYWLSGIAFDIVHMVSNYFIMLTIGPIIYKALIKLNKKYTV